MSAWPAEPSIDGPGLRAGGGLRATLMVMTRLAALLVAAALVVAACGDTTGPLDGASDAPTSSTDPTDGPTVGTPTESPSAEPTPEPTASATSPGDSPSPSIDPSLDPDATPVPGSEAACSGNDDNRVFFAAAAVVLSWDVYCAVLPPGWNVQSGRYRQANGGFLEISYAASGGRTLALREGAFCGDPDGCVPDGPEIGEGSFGGATGTVIAGTDGSWAVVVARGESLSWLAVGTGMDEATFRALAGALHRVTLPGG